MTSQGLTSKPLSSSAQMNLKHVSRIPVLISKTKTSLRADNLIGTSATRAATANCHTPSPSSSSTTTTTTTTTTTMITITSTPKKSVTVTLLPLPGIRRSSLNSNKKLYGILKNSNHSTLTPLQNINNSSKHNNIDNYTNINTSINITDNIPQNSVASSVPDLIKSVPAKHVENFSMIEKWLPCLETIQKENPPEISTNFSKRDSFSDDAASSVMSFSSPHGEPSANSTLEDARWSSATSGYESDETNFHSKPLGLKSRNSIKSKKHLALLTPWLNLKEINFQNVDILTEKEISALNARLERIFDVYKKMERSRSVKRPAVPKDLPTGGCQTNKYGHIKAKVQSNAPNYVNRQVLRPKSVADAAGSKTKQNHSSRSAVPKLKQTKLKPLPNGESPNHFRLFKNCFSSHESKTFTTVKGHDLRSHGRISDEVIRKTPDRVRKFQPNGASDQKLIYSGRMRSASEAVEDAKSRRRVRPFLQKEIEPPEDETSPQPQSPVPREPSEITLGRTIKFKCPRVKQKCSSSVDKRLNLGVCTSQETRREEEKQGKPTEWSNEDRSMRRSNPALLSMKLPKRLSRSELEQVKRSSIRSLTGYGHLGGSMLGERTRVPVASETTRSRDFQTGVTSGDFKASSSSTLLDGTTHRHLPGSFSSSPSLRGFFPRDVKFLNRPSTPGSNPTVKSTTDKPSRDLFRKSAIPKVTVVSSV